MFDSWDDFSSWFKSMLGIHPTYDDLFKATEMNDQEDIVFHIEVFGAKLDRQNWKKQTAAHIAVEKGYKNILEYFLKICKYNDLIIDEDGNVLMHVAAAKGYLEIVKYLFEYRPNSSSLQNFRGDTPLHLAARNNRSNVVKFLVHDGEVSLFVKNFDNKTASHIAIENGHEDIFLFLVKRNFTLLSVKDDNGNTVLHMAASGGNLKAVKFLCGTLKADIFLSNDEGLTPLHLATENGHIDVVRYLVEERGVPIDLGACGANRNFFCNTPLHLAAFAGHLNLMKYFIGEKKMYVDYRNTANETPLLLATHTNLCGVACVQYLLKSKANLNAKDVAGTSVISYAARWGNLEVAKYLLDDVKIEFDVDSTDRLHKTALYYAASSNKCNFVEYLTNEKKADPNIADLNGYSPLYFASVTYKDLALTTFLMNHGADDLQKNKECKTIRSCAEGDIADYLKRRRFGYRDRRQRREALPEIKIAPTIQFPQITTSGRALTPYTNITSSETQNFLILADTFIRYTTGFKYRRTVERISSSPEEIVFRKIDPLALESIKDDEVRFGETTTSKV